MTGDLDLRVILGDTTQWRLTYAVAGARFDPDVPLDHLRQVFGVEELRWQPRGWVGRRQRTYRDLPEESYVEPQAVLGAKRFG